MDLKNKHTATIITVVMIVLSILLGNSLSINKKINQVYDIYNQQISPELDNQYRFAGQLIQFAKTNNGNEDMIEQLDKDLKTFDQIKVIDQKYDAFVQLQNSFKSLYDSLYAMNLGNEPKRTLSKINQQFQSCYELIIRSANNYNDVAKKINRELDSFPLYLMKHLVGKGNIPLFA